MDLLNFYVAFDNFGSVNFLNRNTVFFHAQANS